ncbi:MAG: tetratricopeptide repeat protein [Candidatus Omnitrophica bacterium]|nr:tetratricopeptide repeat protein [Candidatus Omnitrophota bacterium]
MSKRIFFKNFLPLIVALGGAFVFFAGYNHYLLDNSLVNLKLSLRELDGAETVSQIRAVKDILDNAFVAESTKEGFDLAAALKIEIGDLASEKISFQQRETNKKYIEGMIAATEIDVASDLLSQASSGDHIEDAKHFIRATIVKKQKDKSFLRSKLDDFVIALTTVGKKGVKRNLNKDIEDVRSKLVAYSKQGSYSKEDLQREYLKLGQLYLQMKDFDNSLVYLNKVVEADPNNIEALAAKFYSGIAYKAKKDFKKAQLVFNEIKQNLPKEWQGFSSYQEASSLYALGETEKALAMFKENFEAGLSQKTGQLSQLRVGYIYMRDMEDMKAAKAAFDKLKTKSGETEYSDYYEEKIKYDLADHYGYEGFNLLREGYRTSNPEKYYQALKQFDLALGVSSDLDLAYSGKSLAYNLLNKTEEALEEVEKTQQLSEKGAESTIVLGSIYYNLGMGDEAIAEYKRASKINPSLDVSNYNLGTLYLLDKDYAKAKTLLIRAIKVNPDFAEAYNNLGYIFWLERDHRTAQKYFRKAIALKLDYIEPKYNLAVVLFSLGDYARSREMFNQVVGLQSGYRKTEQYLTRIKERMGY